MPWERHSPMTVPTKCTWSLCSVLSTQSSSSLHVTCVALTCFGLGNTDADFQPRPWGDFQVSSCVFKIMRSFQASVSSLGIETYRGSLKLCRLLLLPPSLIYIDLAFLRTRNSYWKRCKCRTPVSSWLLTLWPRVTYEMSQSLCALNVFFLMFFSVNACLMKSSWGLNDKNLITATTTVIILADVCWALSTWQGLCLAFRLRWHGFCHLGGAPSMTAIIFPRCYYFCNCKRPKHRTLCVSIVRLSQEHQLHTYLWPPVISHA